MIFDCYTMDVYCRWSGITMGIKPEDNRHKVGLQNSYSNSYSGPNRRDCVAQAKKDGWVFSEGDVTCPKCARENKRVGT